MLEHLVVLLQTWILAVVTHKHIHTQKQMKTTAMEQKMLLSFNKHLKRIALLASMKTLHLELVVAVVAAAVEAVAE